MIGPSYTKVTIYRFTGIDGYAIAWLVSCDVRACLGDERPVVVEVLGGVREHAPKLQMKQVRVGLADRRAADEALGLFPRTGPGEALGYLQRAAAIGGGDDD